MILDLNENFNIYTYIIKTSIRKRLLCDYKEGTAFSYLQNATGKYLIIVSKKSKT